MKRAADAKDGIGATPAFPRRRCSRCRKPYEAERCPLCDLAPREINPHATSALAVAPALISDLTAPAVVGLEGWQFRELVKAERIPHARIGQRIVARAEDVVLAVVQLGKRQARGGASANDDEPGAAVPAAVTADGLLRRLGRVRTAGGSR